MRIGGARRGNLVQPGAQSLRVMKADETPGRIKLVAELRARELMQQPS